MENEDTGHLYERHVCVYTCHMNVLMCVNINPNDGPTSHPYIIVIYSNLLLTLNSWFINDV